MLSELKQRPGSRGVRWGRVCRRLYELLEKTEGNDRLGIATDLFLGTLIIFNVLALILASVASLEQRHAALFWRFEVFSVAIFTIEYVLRVFVCTVNENYTKPFLGRLRYLLTPMAIIDFFAILPFYLPMVVPFDLRILRLFRLLRITRLLKLHRYSEAMKTVKKVVKARQEELIVTIILNFALLVIVSTLVYYFENPVQPKVFSSIPAAMWWGVATLTTIGYGDVYPVTTVGKLLGAITALLGIGLFALPAGILGSGFIEDFQRKKSSPRYCPHCRMQIDDE